MKKTLTAAVILSFVLLTACGNTAESDSISVSAPEVTEAVTEATTEEVTEPETEEETTESVTEAVTEEITEPETEEETTEAVTEAATEEVTEEVTTEPEEEEMNGAPDWDFVTIAGDWYIDGDTSLASIHIEPDGTFKTYYADGNLENEGYIRYEDEEIAGSVTHWYCLYDTNGEFVMGFVDDGSESKTDIYIGNGAIPHYQKVGA